jgi:DNA-binding transcriptional regulator GbsR (MarR family)
MDPVVEKFVLHWGEMGARWGVNRSVAQIHALLYLSARPMPAEEIAETLGIARSNVSTSIRELQSYELVSVTHALGDRRDHFRAETDPWEMMLRIVEARKKREIDPLLAMLRDCAAKPGGDAAVLARIKAMLAFVEELSAWYERMRKLPRPLMRLAVKLGPQMESFLRRRAEMART